MRLILWTGERGETTAETFTADARKALSDWMEKGDSVRRFEDKPGVYTFVVYTCGEHTDVWAEVAVSQ